MGSAALFPDAVEIRSLTQTDGRAMVDSTVTLALQFKKDAATADWIADAVRLGDRDWVHMSELLSAISTAIRPGPVPQESSPPAAVRIDPDHVIAAPFDNARRRMTELGASRFVPDAIQVQRIISQSKETTIAEATVTLSFEFVRNASRRWEIDAIRLGDRSWIDVVAVITTMHEGRRRDTTAMLDKLLAGIERYRSSTGALPVAPDIVKLTDQLHPNHMTDLVRLDAWGNAIHYERSGSTFRLISMGIDGVRGTGDDIIVGPGSVIRP